MSGWLAALCVLTGTVYDGQHHPLPDVKVYLQASDQLTVKTDSSGVYRFSVASGVYALHAEGEPVVRVELKEDTKIDLQVEPAFFDEPTFNAAGVTDYTYRGGHGSDAVIRSSETLTKEMATLQGTGDPKENEMFTHGSELLDQHKAQAAVEAFMKGVALFPKSVRMLLGLASACYATGSFDEAAQWFFRATDLSPSEPRPYLLLGRVKARQITDARGYKERMARFAKLQPDNALANYYYATTLSGDQAQTLCERALKLDPQLALAHLQLGILAARGRDYKGAIAEYQKAISIDPSLEEAHYRLSEAYRLTGEPAKAKEELATFQRLSH